MEVWRACAQPIGASLGASMRHFPLSGGLRNGNVPGTAVQDCL